MYITNVDTIICFISVVGENKPGSEQKSHHNNTAELICVIMLFPFLWHIFFDGF